MREAEVGRIQLGQQQAIRSEAGRCRELLEDMRLQHPGLDLQYRPRLGRTRQLRPLMIEEACRAILQRGQIEVVPSLC